MAVEFDLVADASKFVQETLNVRHATDETYEALGEHIEKSKEKFEAIAEKAKEFSAILLGIGGGISFEKIIEQASKTELALSKLSTQIGGEGWSKTFGVSSDAVRQKLQLMTGDFGTITELAGGLQAALRFDDSAKSFDVLEAAAELAKGRMASIEPVTVSLTAALRAYGETAESAGRFSDVFAEASLRSGTSLEQMLGTLTPILPAASALGFKIEDVSAAFTTLSKSFGDTGKAGAELNVAFKLLGANEDKLKKLGVDVRELSKQGLLPVVEAIKKASSENGKALQDMGLNMKQLAAIETLAKDGAKGFRTELDALAGSAGSAKRQSEAIGKTFEDMIKDLGHLASTAMGEFGQGIIDAAKPAIDAIKTAVEELITSGDLKEWGESFGHAITVVIEFLEKYGDQAVIVAKTVAVLWAVDKVTTWYGVIIPILKAVSGELGLFGLQAGKLALLGGPVKAVGTVFVAFGTEVMAAIAGVQVAMTAAAAGTTSYTAAIALSAQALGAIAVPAGLAVAAFVALGFELVKLYEASQDFVKEFPDASLFEEFTVAATGSSDSLDETTDAMNRFHESAIQGDAQMKQMIDIAKAMGLTLEDMADKYGHNILELRESAKNNAELKTAIEAVTKSHQEDSRAAEEHRMKIAADAAAMDDAAQAAKELADHLDSVAKGSRKDFLTHVGVTIDEKAKGDLLAQASGVQQALNEAAVVGGTQYTQTLVKGLDKMKEVRDSLKVNSLNPELVKQLDSLISKGGLLKKQEDETAGASTKLYDAQKKLNEEFSKAAGIGQFGNELQMQFGAIEGVLAKMPAGSALTEEFAKKLLEVADSAEKLGKTPPPKILEQLDPARIALVAASVKKLTFGELNKDLVATEGAMKKLAAAGESDLSPAMIQLAQHARETAATLDPLGEGVLQLVENALKLGPSWDKAGVELEQAKLELEELRHVLPENAVEVKNLEEKIKGMSAALQVGRTRVDEIVDSFESMKKTNVKEQLDDAVEALERMRASSEYTEEALLQQEEAVRKLSDAYEGPLAASMRAIDEEISRTSPKWKQMAIDLDAAEKEYDKWAKVLPAGAPELVKLRTEIENLKNEMDPARKAWMSFADDFGKGVAAIAAGSGSLGGILGGLGSSLLGAVGAAHNAGSSILDGFKEAFGGKGENGQENWKNMAAGAIGALGARMAQGAEGLRAVMGNAANYAAQGFAVAGPWGAAVGGIIGGIKGLFAKKPEWEKVSGEIKKQFGSAVSEGTSKAIAELEKTMHVSRQMAEILSLDKIAADAKIGAENIGTFAMKFADLAKVAASGGKGAQEAIAAMGGSFDTLISKMDEAGLEGTAAFGKIVAEGKKMAAQVPAIAEFIKKNVSEAAEGLNMIFSAVQIDAKAGTKALEDLGVISADVFTAMSSLPGGARAAIEQLGSGLDAVVEKAKKAGVALPEGIAGLIGQRDFFRQNKDLYDSIDGLVKVTEGLGRAGFISAKGFEAIEHQVGASFDSLTAKGRGIPDALGDIAPILQQVINEAGRNGKAIDDNTLGLIKQAEALGLVKTAGTDAFAAARQESNYLLEGMATIFGKKGLIDQYIKETGQTAGQTFNEMGHSMNQAFNGIDQTAQNTSNAIVGATTEAAKAMGNVGVAAANAVEVAASGATSGASKLFERFGGDLDHLSEKVRRWLEESGGGGEDNGKKPRSRRFGGTSGEGGMFLLHPDEFVLDKEATKRAGGPQALEAFQKGAGLVVDPTGGRVGSGSSGTTGGHAGGSGDTYVNAVFQLENGETLKAVCVKWVRDDAAEGGLLVSPANISDQRRV